MRPLLLPWERRMAQAVGAQAPVTVQRGRQVTAVGMLVYRRSVSTRSMERVTIATCNISRVERRASPLACRPNIPLNMRDAKAKSEARKKTQAMQTAA